MSSVRQSMVRAAELEVQLSKLPPKSQAQERASVIRTALCELLSDVLLTDPSYATRKDCTGRLWRNCFYGRIVELRGRIHKEKRKEKSSQKNNVIKYEKSLQTFLSEAVRLYQYLVNMYESKILPGQSQLQLSQLPDPAMTTTTVGVVPGLHKMLIHLGDLHRYAEDYIKAETSYTEASYLAPGKGNPYNQLAVVAQMKESSTPLSCVALYWYARALCAVDEPFDTSKGNLARLFESNRKWILQKEAKSVREPAYNIATLSKKAAVEMARSKKSAASCNFLGAFVDLHYDFFKVATSSPPSSCAEKINASAVSLDGILKKKIDASLQQFSDLLEATAFGDSLLCKVVSINAFSANACIAAQQRKQLLSKNGSDNYYDGVFALIHTLYYGVATAQRVEKNVCKIVASLKNDSESKSMNMPSVKLLLPLLLTCDYVDTFWDDLLSLLLGRSPKNNDFIPTQSVISAASFFLDSIVKVANLLVSLQSSLDLLLSHSEGRQQWLKEYNQFVGFSPFRSFVDERRQTESNKKGKDDVYVSEEEAALVLELHTSSFMTQESTSTGGQQQDEVSNKLRVVQFLKVVKRFADRKNNSGILSIHRDEISGFFIFVSHEKSSNEASCISVDHDKSGSNSRELDIDIANVQVEPSDMKRKYNQSIALIMTEKGNHADLDDVLMYKQSESGSGPALLVPGAFIMNIFGKQDDSDANGTPFKTDKARSDKITAVRMHGQWQNTVRRQLVEAPAAALPECSGLWEGKGCIIETSDIGMTDLCIDRIDAVRPQQRQHCQEPASDPFPSIFPAPPPGFACAEQGPALLALPRPDVAAARNISAIPTRKEGLTQQFSIPMFRPSRASSLNTSNPFAVTPIAQPLQQETYVKFNNLAGEQHQGMGMVGGLGDCSSDLIGSVQSQGGHTPPVVQHNLLEGKVSNSSTKVASLRSPSLLTTSWIDKSQQKYNKPHFSMNPYVTENYF